MEQEPNGISIRAAGPEDAARLALFHAAVWEEAYSGLIPDEILSTRAALPLTVRVSAWSERVGAAPTWVAADESGVLRGFVQAGPPRDGTDPPLELMALYVGSRDYGTGLASRLLTIAIGSEPASLWVLDGNVRALRFYRRHGFTTDGATRIDRYGRELRMVRS